MRRRGGIAGSPLGQAFASQRRSSNDERSEMFHSRYHIRHECGVSLRRGIHSRVGAGSAGAGRLTRRRGTRRPPPRPPLQLRLRPLLASLPAPGPLARETVARCHRQCCGGHRPHRWLRWGDSLWPAGSRLATPPSTQWPPAASPPSCLKRRARRRSPHRTAPPRQAVALHTATARLPSRHTAVVTPLHSHAHEHTAARPRMWPTNS